MPRRPATVGLVGADSTTTDEAVADLESRGFEVEVAHGEDDAAELAADRAVDALVVTDDGVDLIAVLEAVTEVDHLLPVVCFPADGDEAFAARAVEFDVAAYVPRSDGVDALAEALEPAVEALDDPLHDAEGMLRAITGTVPESLSIYFKDTEGRHVHVTDHYAELMGPPYIETPDGAVVHTPEDVLGMTDFDIYGPELAKETAEDERRILDTGKPIVNKLEESTEADGSEVIVSTTKAPWHDSTGRLRGIVGVTVDVTEREQNRRALQRQNERLERFAGVLSHDLRNPLGVAQGRLPELDDASDAYEDVEWALDRIEELVTDVLALARQGSVVDDPRPVALAEPVEAAWTTVEGEASLSVGHLPTVQGDPERLRTLFENLFRNAVEHGGQDVGVRVWGIDGGFTVEDDGPGIPEADRERVFEQGYTTNVDGTGFGLSIVAEIVRAHGWEIHVEDGDAGGARFVVEFDAG